MKLSKSDYMAFLKHPAWLWLKKHNKTALPPIDPATQAIFDTGHEFEQYAEVLFPDGVTVGFSGYNEYMSLPKRTIQSLDEGNRTIFQGRFEYEQLTFICDIFQVVNDREIDLVEIKSSTKVKPEHILDLAFQMVVLEECGWSIRDLSVIHVNNQYVRNGAIDPELITAKTNVTEEVRVAKDFTITKVEEALQVMSHNECPNISPLYADPKAFGEWLDVYKYINEPEPGSIFELCRMDAKTLRNLQMSNITRQADIPADFALKPKQKLQVMALQQGHPIVQVDKIKKFLDSFTYPLYFLDYETMNCLVPPFDELRPYQQLPFQYSLHILDSPNAKLRHEEYLHSDNSNPAKPLSEALKSHIGGAGTIITWNMSFEKSCNNLLGTLLPEQAGFYKGLNNRIVDLMTPFSRSWYVDAKFKGSASIKNVLPVLAPRLSYGELGISDGGSAQRLWMETVLDGKHPNEIDEIMNNLIEYCKLDTLAMVEIYLKLKK